MSDFRINNNSIGLPADVAQSLGADALQLISASESHLLLGRPDAENPILLSGILEAGAIPDLLSYFNMFRKTGLLHINLEGGAKALYFQEGEVVFAASTFASEDIGEVLFALGKVEKELLLKLRARVSASVTLGKLLVEYGDVSPRDLWLAARSQVENIVYNLFTAQRGGFYFQQRAIELEQIVRLSMSTQNLIMEGLRRMDEKALFMRKIYSLDHYPVETGKAPVNLGQGEARLLTLCQPGLLTVRDLLRKAGMLEFDGLRLLYGLVEQKYVKMDDAPTTEVEGTLGEVLATYNGLLRSIFAKIVKVDSGFSGQMVEALRDMPQPYSFVLRDVELAADGTLDGSRIVSNLDGLEEGDKQKLLADTLCEVVFIETMFIRRALDAEVSKPLIARVQDVTARIRNLVGRDTE